MSSIYSAIKSILLILPLLCAYGVVGRMDYDDAVMMENAQELARHPTCVMTASSSPQRKPQPLTSGQVVLPSETAKDSDHCKILDFQGDYDAY